MKLRRVHLRRMPGIQPPFAVDGIADGVNVVYGPNGSGKSSTRRAVRLLLFPNPADAAADVRFIEIEADFEDAEGPLRVDRSLGEIRWTRRGEPAEPPPLPEPHLADCFAIGVRDLLQASGQSDLALARQIHRQMSGGYDLAEVRRALFAVSPQRGRRESRALRRAQQALSKLEGEQRELEDTERQLTELEAKRTKAERARARAGALEEAVRLADARRRRLEVIARLDSFPEGIERVRPDDRDELDRLEGELETTRSRIAATKSRIAEKDQALLAAALPRGPAPRADVDAWLLRADEIRSREATVATLATELEELASRRAAAGADLRDAAREARVPDPLPRALADLSGLVERAEDLRARRADLRQERARLETEAKEHAIPEDEHDLLGAARSRLLAWLSVAPDPAALAGRGAPVGQVALLGVLAALGAALAFFHVSGWLLLTAACLAGMVWILALECGRREALSHVREQGTAHQRAFAELGVPGPAAWSRPAVAERLRTLDAELRRAERAREAAQQLRTLAAQQAALRDEERALARTLLPLRDALGLGPEADELRLSVLFRRLLDLREAEAAHASTRAKRDAERTRAREELAAANRFLEAHGLPPASDGARARAALQDLGRRSDDARAALRERRAAGEDLRQGARTLAEQSGRLRSFFETRSLALGNRDGLRQRLGQLASFEALRSERIELDRGIAAAEERLAAQPDLLELEEAELREWLDRTRALARQLDGFNEEIGQHKALLDAARTDPRLETALAEGARSKQELRDCLQDSLRKTAGGFLLDEIARAHEREARPEVLARASQHFTEFTSHRYDLGVEERGERGEPRFFAHDRVRDEKRGLTNLSDGERMQLLLSVRLAFAEHAERLPGRKGEPVPIFLDEAMSLSDPDRFDAIATALLKLAEGNPASDLGPRQILYMSANPDDVRRWEATARRNGSPAPHVIDLAALRDLSRALGDTSSLVPTPPSPIPDPEGRSAEEYGRVLGVPLPAPHDPGTALHLFHLLHDELPLLRRLLTAGIATTGQWLSFASGPAARTLVGDERRHRRLAARVRAALALTEAWSVGRARPVAPVDLERSEAVSETFLERVTAILDECRGDGKALIRALRDDARRPPRWREKSTDELEGFLEDRGLLDRRPALDLEAALRSVVDAVRDTIAAGDLSLEAVRALAHHLWALLERSERERRTAALGRDTVGLP